MFSVLYYRHYVNQRLVYLTLLFDYRRGASVPQLICAGRQAVLQPFLERIIMETAPEHILDVVRRGTVSTNVHMRKLRNFCISMNWIPWPKPKLPPP